MESKHVNIHYWDSNHVESYKKMLDSYLNDFKKELKDKFPDFVVCYNDRIAGSDNGYLFVVELDSGKTSLDDVCSYLLSPERSHLPVAINLPNKGDYGRIENILKEGFDDKISLSKGFLGSATWSGSRNIKKR
jgi:hypothetical protein